MVSVEVCPVPRYWPNFRLHSEKGSPVSTQIGLKFYFKKDWQDGTRTKISDKAHASYDDVLPEGCPDLNSVSRMWVRSACVRSIS